MDVKIQRKLQEIARSSVIGNDSPAAFVGYIKKALEGMKVEYRMFSSVVPACTMVPASFRVEGRFFSAFDAISCMYTIVCRNRARWDVIPESETATEFQHAMFPVAAILNKKESLEGAILTLIGVPTEAAPAAYVSNYLTMDVRGHERGTEYMCFGHFVEM